MSTLDQAIIRLAVSDAKARMERGDLPQDAAASATQGAWREYRMDVLTILLDDCIDRDDALSAAGGQAVPPGLSETKRG